MREIKDIPSSSHQDQSQEDKEPETLARYLRERDGEREGRERWRKRAGERGKRGEGEIERDVERRESDGEKEGRER